MPGKYLGNISSLLQLPRSLTIVTPALSLLLIEENGFISSYYNGRMFAFDPYPH
jgi:hypothetical protein